MNTPSLAYAIYLNKQRKTSKKVGTYSSSPSIRACYCSS